GHHDDINGKRGVQAHERLSKVAKQRLQIQVCIIARVNPVTEGLD
ncbi:MAG: hypothetical protein RJB17_1621, partial [Pseudomonadota bacterium]